MQQSNDIGNNINQKINICQLSNEFIKYFYNIWNTDPNIFYDSIIKIFSCLKFENVEYKGEKFIIFLNNLKTKINFKIEPLKLEFLNSGSRRIEISVIGNIYYDNNISIFFQTFSICHHPKKDWFIKNSTLMII